MVSDGEEVFVGVLAQLLPFEKNEQKSSAQDETGSGNPAGIGLSAKETGKLTAFGLDL